MDEYQEAEHDQHPREVRVLAGHTDIIRIVTRVDDKRYVSPWPYLLLSWTTLCRFVTASDDATAIVWNTEVCCWTLRICKHIK